jgi:hypothetical protein
MRFSFSSLGVLGSWNGCFIFMQVLIAHLGAGLSCQ